MLVIDEDALLTGTAKAAEDVAWMEHIGLPLDPGVIQSRFLRRIREAASSTDATSPEPAPDGAAAHR